MYKVVIADDENHICRLIQALVDWESMNMEVMGFASNGLEAIELVERWNPDLLITDIRMPGCDGIELIKRVRQTNPLIEIIIISGHAEFSYAQMAMKYSVGNYLLKPINKVELNQTILKLSEKIAERKKSEHGLQQLLEESKSSKQQMRDNLITHLLEGTLEEPTPSILRESCDLDVNGMVFQSFCIKIDYNENQVGKELLELVYEKANDIVYANFRILSAEIIFNMKDSYGFGILFFSRNRVEDIKRVMRDCLNQLLVQRMLLGPITFTISISEMEKDTKRLLDTLLESKKLVHERLVGGSSRLIESFPKDYGVISKKALEGYIRMSLQALQMYSEEEAVQAVESLKQEVLCINHPRGDEVLELVLSAGAALLMQVDYKEQKLENDMFRSRCILCDSVDSLFETLLELERKIILELEKERENDTLRPVRLAKQYIRNHYNEQITLEEVSDVVGLSTSYFSALFKKETGEGFAKYLIGIRMEEAKQLLRESNLSIAAICKTVGYNDSKHFTHTFEKATGLKPSAYRKLYG